MKAVRYFALIIGISYLIAGVMGFIPGLITAPKTPPDTAGLTLTTGYGYLLGLFAVNILHNLVHLVVGVLGLVACSSFRNALLFSRGLAIFYTLITLMGLIPATQSTFGLIPIYGNDIWLHGFTAVVAIYFGFFATRTTHEGTRYS